MAAELSRGRRAGIWTLIVLGLVLALVSILSLWVARLLLEEDTYVDTSRELIADPEIQSALSIYLVDRLYANVDVAAELEEALPPDLQPVAAPVAGALRQVAERAALRAFSSTAVQDLWTEANARAHERLLLLLNDEGQFVRTTDGTVSLDLSPIVERVGERSGLLGTVAARLPEGSGTIEIVQSDELEAAQTGVRILDFLSSWVWVLAFGCWAAAIWLARGMRRRTLRALAIAVLALGFIVLLARRLLGSYLVNALVDNESYKPAVDSAWSILSQGLVTAATTTIFLGAVAVLGAWLAGEGRRATSARNWLAPWFRESAVAVYLITAAVFLLLILWGPTPAFRGWLSVLVMAVLSVVGIEALRRQTAREFPDAEKRPLAPGLRARLGGAPPAPAPLPAAADVPATPEPRKPAPPEQK